MSRIKLFNEKALELIKKEMVRWENEILKDKGGDEDYFTESGIPIKLLYTPVDISELDYLQDIGFSGDEPYVRGVYPNMYRGRLFTVRQLAGFGGPEDCNKRIKFLLDHGATGVNIVFDLPTIRGYNSSDPEAEGNVGQCGVAIDSLEDMEALFDGVPVDEISVSLVTHLPSVSVALLAMYVVMAEKRGIPLEKLAGTTQNDFLMETTIGSAPEILPPRHSFRFQCDVVEYAARNLPRWNSISYNGYNLREAGTNAVQEVAIAIANAIATAEELVRRGLPVDSFARRMSFFWDLCNDFFEEIAKCRASRRVFYKVMKERFKAQNPRSLLMRFHVQTAGITLTKVEPLNNIARSAIQALAAILGGAQSLHVDSFDEAYSAPTEEAALVSLRTQQILQTETNIVNTVDPLAGSYYVEYLTNEMEKRIFEYIEEIERRGGIVAVTESGWLHREISNYAYEQQKAIETGKKKIVGVNYMRSEQQEPEIEVFRYPETEQKQKAKLEALMKKRDNAKVKECLEVVREKLKTQENIMPYVIEAVKVNATLGEIEEVFRQEFGLWQFPLT
ncbi:acyl-CoA mutase large subunit family protein [Calderihabitans maritimus]|uniref:Methylmalonyl-CoA mutase n=1 Tax=Calderihabitans maritimus TaxID=1246530 RepID=A0A1Z5HUJ8_9FIRM|nr:methylmalonyl-CoA mutase family protein [Calderihabitans maritimus]GAW92960.1 methylmalonyl-CoA mutase [Calderihabitans maritimus]